MLIGYARVSTEEQNLDAQTKKLQEAGCQKIFAEKISGVSGQRPELTKMLDIVRPGDTVITTYLSRLGRSLIHTLQIIENLGKQNIHFKSLDLGIDTTTPSGEFVLTIFAALAQYERKHMLEQARAGIAEARAKGKHLGRPKGYNKQTFEKITLLMPNYSVSQIAELVGCSTRTVKRYKKIIKELSILMPKKNSIIQQNIFGGVDVLEK